VHFKSRKLVSLLPDKIYYCNVPISLESTIFQLKTLVRLLHCNICTVCGFLCTRNTFLNHRVILRGLLLEHTIFRHRPTCVVIARPIITSLHVHGSLQLFPASQAAKLLLSVTMMKTVSLQYNVSNSRQAKTLLGS